MASANLQVNLQKSTDQASLCLLKQASLCLLVSGSQSDSRPSVTLELEDLTKVLAA